MNQSHKLPERQVPVLTEADVTVVGGGFPGVCAALAAARLGSKVVLIERDGLLGGQAAFIYTFGLCSVIDNTGKQFVRGIPWEIIQKTVAEGQSDPVWDLVDYTRMEREGITTELRRFGSPRQPACRVLHIHATNAAAGQAAGVAASLAAKERVPLRELSVRGVQEALQRQGAVVF